MSIPSTPLLLILTGIAFIACSVLGARSKDDNAITPAQALELVHKNFDSIIKVVFLLALMTMFGLICYIIPGLYLYATFSQSILAILISGKSGISALKYSKTLVARNQVLSASIMLGLPLLLCLSTYALTPLLITLLLITQRAMPTTVSSAGSVALMNLGLLSMAISFGVLYAYLNDDLSSSNDDPNI